MPDHVNSGRNPSLQEALCAYYHAAMHAESDTFRDTKAKPDGSSAPSSLMRLWLWTPDWVFRVLGASFFVGFLAYRVTDYYDGFWTLGPWYKFGSGYTLRVPWVHVLVDATYLLIALGFCFRLPPRSRASRGRDIVIALSGAFLPFAPIVLEWTLGWLSPAWSSAFQSFRWGDKPLSLSAMLSGTILILLGNALDVWGYGTLFRSLSIVPEARELKVRGAYRLVRHPVYLGQIMAQGGAWLCFAKTHVVWITFYFCFVALQLYRSKLEDRVLEQAFGERYRQWKQRTFWFI
ncbi:MAG: isoprenylcysteine carboxylmethyltransferase family protein [Phycisphaerales bacterium]|nr:isoprenylcysteine carboxylmethyltransferase family protein [Phycisphaerales bacterium]